MASGWEQVWRYHWGKDMYGYGSHCLAKSSHDFSEAPETSDPVLRKVGVVIESIEKTHPLVGIYDSICPAIESACSGMDWQAFGAYKIGYEANPSAGHTVILVRVQQSSIAAAKEAVSRIVTVLSSNGLSDVGVQIAING